MQSLTTVGGGFNNNLLFQLNDPNASSQPGGGNAALIQNNAGDIYLNSQGGNGIRVQKTNGNVYISGQLFASNVSILGSYQSVQAYETHSSNVTINSLGTGPALSVSQTESGPYGQQPVATFYAGTSLSLLIDNVGNVALGKPTANATLDISGTMVVSGLSYFGSNCGIAKVASSNYALDVSGSARVSGLTYFMSNVGIAKVASSNYALDVSGSARVSGTINATVATVTSAYGTATSNPTLNLQDSGQYLSFICGAAAGTYNNIVAAGDHLITFNNNLSTLETGNLVIAPWSSSTCGIKILGNGNVGIGKSPTCALDVSGSVAVSGTITGKPAGCRFSAVSTGTTTVAYNGGVPGSGILQYNNALVNIGNVYNASTYTFTAPITGVYSFSASYNNTSWLAYFKNGAAYSGGYPSNANYQAITLSLSAGDTICLISGSSSSLSALNFFNGWQEVYTS